MTIPDLRCLAWNGRFPGGLPEKAAWSRTLRSRFRCSRISDLFPVFQGRFCLRTANKPRARFCAPMIQATAEGGPGAGRKLRTRVANRQVIWGNFMEAAVQSSGRKRGRRPHDRLGLTILFNAVLRIKGGTAHGLSKVFDIRLANVNRRRLEWLPVSGESLRKLQSETMTEIRSFSCPPDAGAWKRPGYHQVRPDPLRDVERSIAEAAEHLRVHGLARFSHEVVSGQL